VGAALEHNLLISRATSDPEPKAGAAGQFGTRFRHAASLLSHGRDCLRLTGPTTDANVARPAARRTFVSLRALAVAAVAVAVSDLASAQVDSNRARNLAATCTSCHGTSGVSQGEIKSLAAVPKADIVNKLRDFKSGRESGTVMPQLAKGYTDEQIDLIAGWFATQKAAK